MIAVIIGLLPGLSELPDPEADQIALAGKLEDAW
jgi:hypothetical protein